MLGVVPKHRLRIRRHPFCSRREVVRRAPAGDLHITLCLGLFFLLVSIPVAGQALPDPLSPNPQTLSRRYYARISDNSTPLVYGLVDVDHDANPRRDASSKQPATFTFVTAQPTAESSPNFDWTVASRESLLFTGIMHTFNLATEAGTRDALNGHWFQQYIQSVSELRGWSDSDKFMAPYVGHTLEGSVFGYIQRQNDGKYRKVQWGDGRDYFISLLHSLAYSALWHTQWKIGPISEASIGNVMLHASPGFITLADTPALGTVEMIAEDSADRYLIMRLENRTANRMFLMLARSFLNPGRSFANLMAFQLPWHRETRIGLFGQNFQIRKELLATYKETGERPFEYAPAEKRNNETRSYPKEAPIELTVFPVFDTFLGSHSCIGGGGSGAARVNPQFQVVAEVSGCLIMHMPQSNQSGDSLFYGGGLRWTPRAASRLSPFLQVMFGGKKVTEEIDDPALRKRLLAEWNNGSGTIPHYPKRSDWSVETADNGPSFAVGCGFDLVLARPFAWRLFNIEYLHAWMGNVGMIQPQDAVVISTGAVLRIGTW